MEIHGTVQSGFESVKDAFEANFAQGLEVGASAAVTIDGESVVDIWAGDSDPNGTPWAEDTLVNVYSTTKTMAGLCMLMLADRGQLDFSAPVAQSVGSWNPTSAPPVGDSDAHTSPPCTSTTCATIDSPSPEPGID